MLDGASSTRCCLRTVPSSCSAAIDLSRAAGWRSHLSAAGEVHLIRIHDGRRLLDVLVPPDGLFRDDGLLLLHDPLLPLSSFSPVASSSSSPPAVAVKSAPKAPQRQSGSLSPVVHLASGTIEVVFVFHWLMLHIFTDLQNFSWASWIMLFCLFSWHVVIVRFEGNPRPDVPCERATQLEMGNASGAPRRSL